ncbi:MAG TPA: CvpA family protein [Bryobacteraceae bacterium]|nr:CvpA family protein [Bryobacteraceae bacterium]
MSLLDLLLIAIIGLSIAAGFVAGFARVGIGLIAAVVGLLFGFWFYGIPAGWIHRYIGSRTVSDFLGFFIVFFGVLSLGALIGKALSKFFRWTGLSWLDRLLGAVFGFLRGGLIAVIFVAVLLAFTPKPVPNWMVNSRMLPYAVDASNVCASLAPNALKQGFRDGVQEVRKDWNEQLNKAQQKKREINREPPANKAEP